MARYQRDKYAKRLARWLSEVDDEGLISLVWGVDTLQSDSHAAPNPARQAIAYRPEHAVTDLVQRYFIHKWTLETLVNEALVHPKAPINPGLNYRKQTHNFENIIDPYNYVLGLEDAQFGVSAKPASAFDEMARIGHRQFEWQRGHFNVVDLYRSAFLFGGPKSATHFEAKNGLPLAQFVLAGFAMYIAFRKQPVLGRSYDLTTVGIDRARLEKVFSLLALPIERARVEAGTLRRGSKASIAYRPSVLRRFPCVTFGAGSRVRAPLPPLVMARTTTGLYYDLVGASGEITNEIGSRFEDYCFDYLSTVFPSHEWKRATDYNHGGLKQTPDIRMFASGACRLVIECKSKRMTIAARYSQDPLTQARSGFEEVAKGVWQIWRYFSHVRRGLIPNDGLHAEALGLVLTLDPWMQMNRLRHTALIEMATLLADQDDGIEMVDRKPVAFCSIVDFERLLMKASLDSFLDTVRRASDSDAAGWHLEGLHDQNHATVDAKRAYPFKGRVGEILPWWDELEKRRKA